MTARPQTAREQHIAALIVDAEMARQELADVLERGDVYRIHACLKATHRRTISDLALGYWFLRNSVRGAGRYLRASWIVGWRRGWKR
jgi:hypothetical protein